MQGVDEVRGRGPLVFALWMICNRRHPVPCFPRRRMRWSASRQSLGEGRYDVGEGGIVVGCDGGEGVIKRYAGMVICA